MAGIEEAFKKFVTRVSDRERSKAEEPLSKYKSYSEEELLGNIEAKRPNQLQSFSLEDYQLNTMPMIEPRDVAPPRSYSPMPNIYNSPRLSQVDLAEGGVASMFRERPGYAEGGSLPTSVTAPSGIDYELFYSPFSGKPLYRPKYDPSRTDLVYSGMDPEQFFKDVMATGVSTPTTTEVPTVDPFSGQQLSLQEAISLAEQMTPPTPAAGYTEEGLRKISEDTASRVNAVINAFNAGFYNQTPTVDPFSGQQVSMQDQMSFTQPQADIFAQQNIPQPPSPVDQFISERRFQAEADAAARSGIPFTKTIQDYLPNIGFNVPGHMDYFNQIREAGLPTSEYHRLGTADLVQRNIDQLPSILKPIAGALAPVTAFASSIPYELTQASQRMQPGSGIGGFYNAYMNESPLSAASNRFIGAAQPLANQIQNLLSPLASSAQRSQQEAAARVTPRMTMAYGGLTNTIPPAMGPDSQGVESLFRRRYN